MARPHLLHLLLSMEISGVCRYSEQMPLISHPRLFRSPPGVLGVPALLLYATQMQWKWEVKESRVIF